MLKFSIGEQFNRISLSPNEAGLSQQVGFDNRVSGEPVEITDMDNSVLLSEGTSESPLGKTSLKGHLSSLKTGLGPATGPGFLALGPPTRCLAVAGTNSSAHSFPLFLGTFRRSQFIQSHAHSLSIIPSFHHFQQMSDSTDHAANLGTILQNNDLI